jgi:hypothetical protein
MFVTKLSEQPDLWCKKSLTYCEEIQRYCVLSEVTLFIERLDFTYGFCGEYLKSVGLNFRKNVSNGSRECRWFIMYSR